MPALALSDNNSNIWNPVGEENLYAFVDESAALDSGRFFVAVLLLYTYYENNFIEVVDQDEFRSLYFHNKVVQSRMSLQEPHKLILKYTQYMMAAALLVKPAPTDILLIGIGAGALIHFLHHHFPSSLIDAVDYSEHVIKIARGYFYYMF